MTALGYAMFIGVVFILVGLNYTTGIDLLPHSTYNEDGSLNCYRC